MRKMVMIQWENQADSILTNDPTISHNGEMDNMRCPVWGTEKDTVLDMEYWSPKCIAWTKQWGIYKLKFKDILEL